MIRFAHPFLYLTQSMVVQLALQCQQENCLCALVIFVSGILVVLMRMLVLVVAGFVGVHAGNVSNCHHADPFHCSLFSVLLLFLVPCFPSIFFLFRCVPRYLLAFLWNCLLASFTSSVLGFLACLFCLVCVVS